MTYEDIIPRLDDELRDEEAWPSDTSKINEQINLLYVAALTIGREIPLGRFDTGLVESSAALTGTTAKGVVDRYDLNESGVEIFDLRYAPDLGVIDMGIAKLRLDGVDYTLQQGISVEDILAIGDNGIHSSRTLFALDFPNDQIYASNVTDFKLYYVKKPRRPTNEEPDDADDYKVLTWPLQNDTDTQRAIHLVASHVSGVTVQDPAGAQFQALLENVYEG